MMNSTQLEITRKWNFIGAARPSRGVFLGITQLRDMYRGKISRAWEVPVWIGTIAGAIGLLLQFVSFISAGHRY